MLDSLRKIFSLFSPKERRQAYWIFFTMVVMAVLDVIGVASIMPFMAVVSNPENIQKHTTLYALYQAGHFTDVRQFLLAIGFGVLGILLLGNTYTIFTTWLITRFAALREYSLSKRLLAKYLSQPYVFFLNQNTANLVSNILTEITTVVSGTFMPALQMIAKMIVAVLIVTLLFLVNPLLAIASIIFLGGAYSLIYLLARRKLAAASNAHVLNNQQRYKIASEALGGIKDIKLLSREQTFLDLFSLPARERAKHLAVSHTVALIPRYALETVAFGGVLLIVIYFLLTNQNMADVMPMLALYAFACIRLMPALQVIFAGLTYIKAYQGALNTIYQDLGTYANQTLPSNPALIKPLAFQHELKLNALTYAYAGSIKPVIENLNLTIPAKTTIGFVGVTGAGKTTAADIILGLLHPKEGYLSVDSIQIDKTNLQAWQKNLGYVPQAIYLADDTVTRNIAFGVPDEDIDKAAILRAAAIANIHDFVLQQLPDQYDTLLGERGVRLSGGQRQRIGIARALYHDPQVLVLDEATSSLDGMTENVIMDAVHSLSRKKTIIIIAHRLATIKECDIIYIFECGKIVASGTYDELLVSDRYFNKLAQLS